MAVELSTRAIALVDADQQSRTVLRYAHAFSGPVTVMATVDTKLANTETDVVRSLSAEPSMREVLALAGERKAPWVVMRSGITAPDSLLTELILGAGKADTNEIPGFGVLLVGPGGRAYQRILIIADRTHGPMSGLLMYMATMVGARTGAIMDVLVIGGPGEDVAADDEFAALAVNREEHFLAAAQELADQSGVTINWLAAVEVTDSVALVTEQLQREQYDLVIDDIGDLAVGGGIGRSASPEDALLPGNVAAVPHAVLSLTDSDVLLVIDAIRVGLVTSRMLRVGALAAAALAVVAGGGTIMRATGSPAVEASASTAEASETVLNELATTTADLEKAKERAKKSKGTSRSKSDKADSKSSSSKSKPSKPKAPKGGASASDVNKAKKSEAKAEAEYSDAKAAKDKAAEKAAKADAALAAAQEELARAQTEITSAQETYDAAVQTAEQATEEGTGIAGVLPSAPTPEEIAAAEQAVVDAQAWLAAATARGEEALTDLGKSQKREASTDKAAAKAQEEAAAAKADLDAAQEKTEAYQESLADSKQSPVRSGQYNITAQYGQPGSAWSKGYHTGLDFAAPEGTNVYAAASGTVVESGWGGAYGNRVGIKHPDGTYTWYNHLSNIDVSVGDRVSTGEKIGDVGNTGNSFGAHLHFEVTTGGDGWSGGSFKDPAKWLGL